MQITPVPIVGIVIALCSSAAVDAELAVAKGGTSLCTIYHTANSIEKKAASQLGKYLHKITGAKFELSLVEGELPVRGIFVGQVDGTRPELKEEDGFVIRTDGERLFIIGGSPGGTMYGVYGFLEEVLGCRWWSHNEEDVPTKAGVVLGDLSIRREPAFSMHHMMNLEAQSNANDFKYKGRGTGRQAFTGSHNMYKLMAAYGKEHPEIYPTGKDGTRKPNNLHLCYLSPKLPEALAEALAKQVEAKKGRVKDIIYFAGMGDWYGGQCLCDDCQAVYKEETWTDPDGRSKSGYTGTLIRMINRTAEILEKKYPGIVLGTFAYMSLEAPPAKTKPRHNVTIRVPRLRHCTVHSARTCPKNRSFKLNVERWCELAPGRVYIWDYGTNYKSFVFPFPCIDSISDNIKLYRDMGVRGVMVQGNYVTTGSDLVVLKNYVWSKLMWNPDANVAELIGDFCDGYYGPASKAVQTYVRELETSVREPAVIHADEFAQNASYLKQPARDRLAALRTAAIEATAGEQPWRRRVGEATVGIEALTLAGRGMKKAGGKSIVKDGVYEWSKLSDYSFPRAKAVAEHLRSSGVNEWTTGLSYWLAFLKTHSVFGTTVTKLRRGPIAVDVAPDSGGQIRQIYWKGHALLAATDADTGTVGGSDMKFGAGFGRTEGTPTETQIRIHDGLQIPNWRWSARYIPAVWKNISVEDGRVVSTAGTLPKAKPRKGSIVTVYNAGKGATQIKIEHQSPGETEWRTVESSEKSPEIVLPTAGTFRVTFKDQKCVIEDQYFSPSFDGSRITFDSRQKLVTVAVLVQPMGNAEVSEESALLELPEENASFLRIIKVRSD